MLRTVKRPGARGVSNRHSGRRAFFGTGRGKGGGGLRAAAVWCVMGILVLAASAGAASGSAPTVTVDGVPQSGLSVALYDGQPYLAVSSLPRLHANVVVDRATGRAAIGIGRRSILLDAGSPTATVDGQPVPRKLAPLMDKGDIWLPAEWLTSFALTVAWQERTNTLALAWPRPSLLSVSLDKSGESARIIVEATAEIKATVFTLRQPDRLVIDLQGLAAYGYLQLDERENEYFSRLRAAMNRPGVLRLVADLRQAVGYRVDNSQAKAGRLSLELNTLVYGVSIVPAEEGRKLVIEANHKPTWTVGAASNPDRILIGLQKVTLLPPPSLTVPGGDDWLLAVECKTPTADRVEVTAYLKRPQTLAVTPARDTDNRIEVQPMQNLGRLVWRERAEGFTLTSSGMLSVSPAIEHYPERLVLTVLHATAMPDEGVFEAGAVGHYRVAQAQPGIVQIALDLQYDTPFKMEFSPDRHQMTVQFQPSPLVGKVIVLDAGHGGVETGALGHSLGLREKDINFDVTLRLKELLEKAGAAVYLTRVDDSYVPLYARASYASRLPAEIFVSIHSNSHDDPAVHGVETFSYPEKTEDHRLASLMHEEMVAALNLLPRGAKTADFAVLRESQVLSVLIELGFLSNTAEEARLATEDFRRRAAAAIFRAITRFARGDAAATGLPGPRLAN